MMKIATGVLGVALLLSGCAQTGVLESRPSSQADNQGLVYSLPSARIQVDASRKLITDEDVKAAEKAHADAQARLANASAAMVAAKGKLATAQGDVDAISQAEKARAEGLEKARLLAVISLRAREAEVAIAKELVKSTSDRLDDTRKNEGHAELSVSLKALPPAPDSRYRFTVVPTPSMTRDDNVKLVTENGLLNTVNGESTGQVSAILVNFASAMSGLKARPAMVIRRTRQKSLDGPLPAAQKISCQPFAFSEVFDPSDAGSVKKIKDRIQEHSGNAIELDVDIAGDPGVPADGGNEKVSGLHYRTLVPVRVAIRDGANSKCRPTDKPTHVALNAIIPDSRASFVMPMVAGSFVKTKNDFSFKDGVALSHVSDNPSQLAAISRIPVDILKAVVEVPASILKLRVDYDSQAVALTQAQTNQLKAQLDLLNAQKELDAAQVD